MFLSLSTSKEMGQMEIFLLTFMTLVPLILQIDPFQGLENAIANGIVHSHSNDWFFRSPHTGKQVLD